jgi:hypothetical protein
LQSIGLQHKIDRACKGLVVKSLIIARCCEFCSTLSHGSLDRIPTVGSVPTGVLVAFAAHVGIGVTVLVGVLASFAIEVGGRAGPPVKITPIKMDYSP